MPYTKTKRATILKPCGRIAHSAGLHCQAHKEKPRKGARQCSMRAARVFSDLPQKLCHKFMNLFTWGRIAEIISSTY